MAPRSSTQERDPLIPDVNERRVSVPYICVLHFSVGRGERERNRPTREEKHVLKKNAPTWLLDMDLSETELYEMTVERQGNRGVLSGIWTKKFRSVIGLIALTLCRGTVPV